MRLKQLLMIGLMLMSSLVVSGCIFKMPEHPVYVPLGVVIEVAEDVTVVGWVRDSEGIMSRRNILVSKGWLIGRGKSDGKPTNDMQ